MRDAALPPDPAHAARSPGSVGHPSHQKDEFGLAVSDMHGHSASPVVAHCESHIALAAAATESAARGADTSRSVCRPSSTATHSPAGESRVALSAVIVPCAPQNPCRAQQKMSGSNTVLGTGVKSGMAAEPVGATTAQWATGSFASSTSPRRNHWLATETLRPARWRPSTVVTGSQQGVNQRYRLGGNCSSVARRRVTAGSRPFSECSTGISKKTMLTPECSSAFTCAAARPSALSSAFAEGITLSERLFSASSWSYVVGARTAVFWASAEVSPPVLVR